MAAPKPDIEECSNGVNGNGPDDRDENEWNVEPFGGLAAAVAAIQEIAANVHIQAETADSWLRLAVRDDGAGFDVDTALERGETFGLAGMRERVELLGGRFHISSRERGKAARSGTKVCIELPLAGVAA